MRFIYSLVIFTFTGLIHIASLFNGKASLWVKGRRGWEKMLRGKVKSDEKTVWIHCASLGEFEQGRPVIEAIKKRAPEYKILVTFFSPSGYEIRKNWTGADNICYLPADTPKNARKFIEIVNPTMVLFIKYEFWNNYISELYRKEIPLYLVSGIFRSDQHFFKWYGSFFRNILRRFSHVFVQDTKSLNLLFNIGLTDVSVSGDTRFDRVKIIAETSKKLPIVEKFIGNEKVFIAGSSWPPDEEIIAKFINTFPGTMKYIFAPHEIDRPNIERLESLLEVKTMRYSDPDDNLEDARVLIIDNIGMLSSVYKYGSLAEVGGGFGKGIHNILEPACWGIPVLFGPDHTKFNEALELLEKRGAFRFDDYEEFELIINRLNSSADLYSSASKTCKEYIAKNIGATEKIVALVLEKDINN
jgi:3-deoxy-D-manno-octulosonic-acid transferase